MQRFSRPWRDSPVYRPRPSPSVETLGYSHGVPMGRISFREQLASAWTDGSGFLLGSIAGIVRVVIGGLVWWVALCAVLWLVRRWYLRRTELQAPLAD